MLITKMNALLLIIWICVSAIPALAQSTATTSSTTYPCPTTATCRSAPAPLIGFGFPAALAVGGVLLGAKLLKRTKRS
jgi:hypothetical protein